MAKKVSQRSKMQRNGRNGRNGRKVVQKRRVAPKPVVKEVFEFHGDVELKPHHMIIQMLKVGKPVLVSEIMDRLGDYITNLNSHIHAIKQMGGYLRYGKEGRSVVSYHLLNHTNYNKYGQPTPKAIESNLIQPETRSETVPYQQAA